MRKIYLFYICLAGFGACTTDQSETSDSKSGTTQLAMIKGTNTKALDSDSVDMHAGLAVLNQVIVPGRSVGLIRLNEQAEVVYKLLGKPHKADAGMGKMLATWFIEPKLSDPDTGNSQTNIFFSRNMGSAEESSLAKQIRVTSPEYKLENRIGVGSDLKTIQTYFPAIKKAAIYTQSKTNETITIYHDLKSGIAFEMNKAGKCVGLSIQEPGKANFEVYTAVSNDLKRI